MNQSILLLLLIFLFRERLGPQTLVLGFFVYTLWNTLFLGSCSRRFFRWTWENPFRDPDVRQMFRMMVPLLLGYSMIYVNQQVDKILVSGLEPGTVTAMGYAAVLSDLIGTLVMSFCSILFTHMTARISRGEDGEAAKLLETSAVLLSAVFLPISVLTVCCAEDVVALLFGHGAFGAGSVQTTALALVGYGFSFVPLVLRELYSRFQYGYQDSRRPMINSTVGILCNIVLSIALCPRFGVLGVTLASSVSVLVCGGLNMITAGRRHAAVRHGWLRLLPLFAAGGAVCFLLARWSLGLLADRSLLLRLILVTLLSCGGYGLVMSPLLLWLKKQYRT